MIDRLIRFKGAPSHGPLNIARLSTAQPRWHPPPALESPTRRGCVTEFSGGKCPSRQKPFLRVLNTGLPGLKKAKVKTSALNEPWQKTILGEYFKYVI